MSSNRSRIFPYAPAKRRTLWTDIASCYRDAYSYVSERYEGILMLLLIIVCILLTAKLEGIVCS